MDLFFVQKRVKNAQKLDCFTVPLATKWVNVFGHFWPIFGLKIDPKYPRGNFLPKRIHQKKFQLKIPIFSKSDGDATWWPNSYKKNLTCSQLKNIQRYQKYVRHVRSIFLELHSCSSQQWVVNNKRKKGREISYWDHLHLAHDQKSYPYAHVSENISWI